MNSNNAENKTGLEAIDKEDIDVRWDEDTDEED